MQGEFGVISLAFGSRAKLLFRFVWPGTYEDEKNKNVVKNT